jgi:hypothetical protein
MVGVVVVDLVVVPGDDPRRDGVERDQLAADVLADVAAGGLVVGTGVLVDVVAQVEDDVRMLLGHPPVRGEPAVLVLRARRDRERDRRRGAAGRCRAGAADGGQLAERLEALPVPGVRVQSANVDVDGVRLGPDGRRGAAADRAAEVLGGGDLPPHADRPVAEAAVGGERVRRQPGPDHDGVGQRIARRDTERERVGVDGG